MNRLGLLAPLLVLLVTPIAAAHGAGVAREVDTRVLVDSTENGDYGTTGEEATGMPLLLYEGGHDLLVLDVREGRDPTTGEALLWFRLINQAGDPSMGKLREVLTFTLNGTRKELAFETTDNRVYTGVGFDRFATIEVGDDFVTGAEGAISFANWSLGPGTQLEDLRVQGFVGTAMADKMPGGYYYRGTEVSPQNPPPSVSYVLLGPRTLVNATDPKPVIEGVDVSWDAEFTSQLGQLSQFVNLSSESPALATSTNALNLGPGDARRATFTTNLADAFERLLNVTYSSDLGDWGQLKFFLVGGNLPVDDVLDEGLLGLEDNETLPRGGRYAYTFRVTGDFPIRIDGTEYVFHVVPGSGGNGSTVVWTVPGEPGNRTLAIGDTLLILNVGEAPVAVTSELPVATSERLPAPGALVAAALLLAAILRFRARRDEKV